MPLLDYSEDQDTLPPLPRGATTVESQELPPLPPGAISEDVKIAPDPAAEAAFDRARGVPLYTFAPGAPPQKELPPPGEGEGEPKKDIGRYGPYAEFGKQLEAGYYGGLAPVDRLTGGIAHLLDTAATKISGLTGLEKSGLFKQIEDWAKEQQKYREEQAAELAGGRRDLSSQLTRGAVGAVMSLPVTAAATTALGPVGGMATLGALETADQGPGNMLKGAAEGALMGKFLHVLGPYGRPIRIPAVAGAEYVKNIAQGVDPETALANALNMGALTAIGGPGTKKVRNLPGVLPETLPEGMRFKPTLNPVQKQAVEYLRDELRVPLTGFQQTGNRFLGGIEATTAHTPLGSQRAREFHAGTQEAMADVAQEIAGKVHATPVSPYEGGKAAGDALDKQIAELHEKASDAYDTAWQHAGKPEFNKSVPVKMETESLFDEAGEPTGQRQVPVYKDVNMPVDVRWLKEKARDEIEDYELLPAATQSQSDVYSIYKTLLKMDDFVPARRAEKMLQGFKAEAGYNTDPSLRNESQGAAAGVIPRLQRDIDAAVAETGADSVAGLQGGRRLHAEKEGIAEIAKKLREEPVEAFNQLSRRKDGGVDFLKAVAKHAPDAMPKVGRAYLDNLFDQATKEGGWMRADGVFRQWDALGPQTKALLFPNEGQVQALDRFFLASKITAERINTSGTQLVKAADDAGINALKWFKGKVAGDILFSPRGIKFLTGIAQNPPRTSAQTAALKAQAEKVFGPSPKKPPEEPPPPATPPTGGGPTPSPTGGGGAAAQPPLTQRIREGLRKFWESEEGQQKVPWLEEDYAKHQPPPEGEPVSPLKPLQPPEIRRSGKLEGSLHYLRRAAEREPGVGGPDNARTVLRDDKGEFVVGKLTPEDWVNRVNQNLSADEMVKARQWYRELAGFFKEHFGEEEGPKMALAWLSSQQNVSPSGGMTNVLRVLDELRGMPKEKIAGLAEAKIRAALKGETPEGGYGAKLNDFVDSAMGKTTRTWMGDDPRGGQPAVIDVWANRDVGKLDQKMLDYLTERFGSKAIKKLKLDGTGIGETDYEYGSRFYNQLVKALNKSGYDGGGWTGDQVQAVGWTAMQKALGATPEFASDLITKNTRRYGWEVQPGEGAPILKQYPWETLSTDQQAKITDYVGTRVTDLAAQLTGAKITNREITRGAYLGQPTISVQMDVFASPETFRDFGRAAGYLGQQSEVWHVRPLKSGNAWAYFVRAGKGLDTPEIQRQFWEKLRDRVGADLVPGYSPISDADGNGLFIVNPFSKQYLFERAKAGFKNDTSLRNWTAGDKAKIDAGIEAVEKEMGLSLNIDFDRVDLGASLHNWARKGKKNGHIQRLTETGRSSIAERLSDHAPEALQSWWKEAWDKYAGSKPPTEGSQ